MSERLRDLIDMEAYEVVPAKDLAAARDRIEELEGDLEAAKRGSDSFFERECELLRGENENLRAALLAYQKRDAKQVGEKCVCSLCYEAEKLLTGSDTLTASEASPREEQP